MGEVVDDGWGGKARNVLDDNKEFNRSFLTCTSKRRAWIPRIHIRFKYRKEPKDKIR
jgi:hypothetical protein